MKAWLAAICAWLALTLVTAAYAAPLLVEDFESGKTEGWVPSGGDVRLTQYAGNTSLRLTGRAAVVRAASTRGASRVTIGASLAASGLGPDDTCRVEVSRDGGRTWTKIVQVGRGDADGVTLHSGSLHDATFDDAEQLLIGARISARPDALCWLDNVRIAGEPATSSARRSELQHDALVNGLFPTAEFSMSAFAPDSSAQLPLRTFNGTLVFDAEMTGFHLLRDRFGYGGAPALKLRSFPHVELALTQVDDRLVPLQRGPIASEHPSWNIAVEPGRVWTEARDAGLTRAALPFALIETGANCTHNGVLTFLFGDDLAVSHVAWLVASETCAYLQFDAWGVTAASAHPLDKVPDAALAAFAAERTNRMPSRPFSALRARYPKLDEAAFASPADIDPASLTAFGLIADGVHYLGGCDTRAGPYPFCEELLVPSYSLAKSLVAGLGLMRLESIRPGATRETIAANVNACKSWDGVTFVNALDMATGRYRSSADQADENAMTADRFFLADMHAEKLQIACTKFPPREPPGRRWVYHTTDTYALGTAMAELWRREHGAEADFFDDVLVKGIYAPLSLSPTIRATRRTLDVARQPFIGWGLTLTRDDIAKLGGYLVSPTHAPSLVDEKMLSAALQRDPAAPGLPAGGEDLRYQHGFWAFNAQRTLACPRPVWVPFMSGFGGIIVALMPNGVVYYYVSDGGAYAWARAVRAADAIAPLCPERRP